MLLAFQPNHLLINVLFDIRFEEAHLCLRTNRRTLMQAPLCHSTAGGPIINPHPSLPLFLTPLLLP